MYESVEGSHLLVWIMCYQCANDAHLRQLVMLCLRFVCVLFFLDAAFVGQDKVSVHPDEGRRKKRAQLQEKRLTAWHWTMKISHQSPASFQRRMCPAVSEDMEASAREGGLWWFTEGVAGTRKETRSNGALSRRQGEKRMSFRNSEQVSLWLIALSFLPEKHLVITGRERQEELSCLATKEFERCFSKFSERKGFSLVLYDFKSWRWLHKPLQFS